MKTHLSTFLLCIFIFTSLHAQLVPYESLKKEPLYKSLEDALADPLKVTRLSLKGDDLHNLDIEISRLVNLQWLDLSNNEFNEFPVEITKLEKLQWLDLSKNNIPKIPNEIGRLKHLKYFAMSRGRLYLVSPEMGKLTEMERLELWDNPIKTFPDEIRGMIHLKLLDIRVVDIDEAEKKKLMKLFPYSKIKFSKTCNCK